MKTIRDLLSCIRPSFTCRDDTDAYQLVTWSKDQSLRIWKIEASLQETVGQEFEEEDDDDEEESDELEELGAKGVEDRISLLPRSVENRERATTSESQGKFSEFDIIEMDDVRRIEEKEKRDRELEESHAKEVKEERRHSAKDAGVYGCFSNLIMLSFPKLCFSSFINMNPPPPHISYSRPTQSLW